MEGPKALLPLTGSLHLAVKFHTLFQLQDVHDKPFGVREALISFTALLEKELMELQLATQELVNKVILFIVAHFQEVIQKGFRGYFFLLVQVQEFLGGVRGFGGHKVVFRCLLCYYNWFRGELQPLLGNDKEH